MTPHPLHNNGSSDRSGGIALTSTGSPIPQAEIKFTYGVRYLNKINKRRTQASAGKKSLHCKMQKSTDDW